MSIVKERRKVVLLFVGEDVWTQFFQLFNLEHIVIVAAFGQASDVPEPYREDFEKVMIPLDMLDRAPQIEADFFLIDGLGDANHEVLHDKLRSVGIARERIINLSPFISESLPNVSYYSLWDALKQQGFMNDFFATGISYFSYGLDLPCLEPWQGVNLARPSQDLYYSYRMAKLYLQEAASRKHKIQFALIGLCPYSFHYNLSETKRNASELYYLPYLGWDELEGRNQLRSNVMIEMWDTRYRAWYQQSDRWWRKNGFDLNDIDQQKARGGSTSFCTPEALLGAAEEMRRLGMKNYPETLQRNLQILAQYVDLCHQYEVTPIGLVLPFSKVAQRHYPDERLKEFFQIIGHQSFLTINLWNLGIGDDCFRDLTHLNIKGRLRA